MSGQFDVHAVAIAAVGAAAVEDPRIKTTDRYLVGAIVTALKRDMTRLDTNEATLAVKRHYRQSSDPLTAEALIFQVRRQRMAEFRAENELRNTRLSQAQHDQMLDDWDAIRCWPCPDCGASPNEYCTNSVTKEPMGHCPGHPGRILLATKPQPAQEIA